MKEEIVSQTTDYAKLYDYHSPAQVREELRGALPPRSAMGHTLHHTAHCYVSERHDKGDLVDLVYMLLLKQHALEQLLGISSKQGH